jgi:hypothetical protein
MGTKQDYLSDFLYARLYRIICVNIVFEEGKVSTFQFEVSRLSYSFYGLPTNLSGGIPFSGHFVDE